jgi:hypothetical protein
MVFPTALTLGSRSFIFYIEKIKYCQSDDFFVEKHFAKRNLIFKLFSIRNRHIKKQYLTFDP